MAGIGFELRKLFHEQGLINNFKAYAYSSLTTVGPMILCMILMMAFQRLMNRYDSSYMEWELYVATVAYIFIFSIVLTSGITMLLTRYVADMIYEQKYERMMSSYYGTLIVMLPIASLVAVLFLSGVVAPFAYKVSAYLFFVLLVMIWIQGVYLSALKDYVRISRGFAIGSLIAYLTGWLLFRFTDIDSATAALIGFDVGFFIIVVLSGYHFEQRFPRAQSKYFFEYLTYFKKYPSLFLAGCFVYSGVYVHNFIYWLSPRGVEIADQFRIMPFYDVSVFFAFLSVMPTLVTFVVSVETSFFEKFRTYYLNVLQNGTIRDVMNAKKQMQKTLVKEISFLMEVQLVFTVLSIALGIKFLPMIGFTMSQLDLFIILALGYFLFITLFVMIHILMYFDDRKGVVMISFVFTVMNIGFTYWILDFGFDGLGMFIASFLALAIVIMRLLYVLRNIDYFTFCAQPINQIPKTKNKSIFQKPGTVVSAIVMMMLLLTACSTTTESSTAGSTVTKVVNRAEVVEITDTALREDKRLYERDDDSSLKTLYVTVLPYRETNEPFDWYSLNRQTDKATAKELEVIVQEGLSDGIGPKSGMFGYSTTTANATIEIRGNSTWYESQKSYRIRLNPDAGLYMDQRTLNLNKHVADFSRMRNKLSFDLMETIPNMTSLRTQYVHLYVKDLSSGNGNASYEDFGLFTHIEQPNKQFLKSHMLDSSGYLYKAIDFEYLRYEDILKNVDDPTYDKDKFQTVLDISGREDHAKLIEMLEAVNDYGIPIEETLEKYFDLDNFLTWTAMNILMDNIDTMSQNFFLYSPLNSEKWYIIPWDYDYGFHRARNRHPFQHGVSLYWSNTLHQRYFRNMDNVEKLIDKLEELQRDYINEDTISAQINKYRDIVEPFIQRKPDIDYLPKLISEFDAELQKLIDTPKMGMEKFYTDLERPKPFFLNDVQSTNTTLNFSWGLSFDFQDDQLYYDLTIAKDKQMNNIVVQENDIVKNSFVTEKLPDGIYYWKVIVRDEQGNTQFPFDYMKDDNSFYFGIREFEVK